ncbi:MAG: hypothetical protein ACP5KV_03750 [Candidatus Methanomethylicaceae archaeon]
MTCSVAVVSSFRIDGFMLISAVRRSVHGKYVIAKDLDKRDERVHALKLKMGSP